MKVDWNYLNTRWHDLTNHRAFKKAPLPTIFRTLSWGIHCLFKIPAIIELPKWSCRFYLPPKFRRAGSTGIFITREDYDPELAYLEHILSPGNVFVDGGANFGIYTVVASKLVGSSGLVLSFEPADENFSILKRNVELNNLSNVRLFKSALSDRKGKARFYHIDNAPNSYSLGGNSESVNNFEEIHTTTLDNVLRDEGITRVDFLKLDVEGAEELVLHGARSLFEQMRPTVLFEVNGDASGRLGLPEDGAWNFLKEFGYQFFAIGNTGELISIDQIRVGNNIAISRSAQHSRDNGSVSQRLGASGTHGASGAKAGQ